MKFSRGFYPQTLGIWAFFLCRKKVDFFFFFFLPEPLSNPQTKGSFLGPKGTRMKRPPPLGFCEKEPKKGDLNPF